MRRHHRDAEAGIDELAEDAALHAVVDHDHVMSRRLRFPAEDALVPLVGSPGAHLGSEILSFHAGKLAGLLHQGLRRRSGRIDDPLLRSGAAENPHEATGVDALDADHAVPGEPGEEGLVAAPVARLATHAPGDESGHLRHGRLLVAVVDAVVAELRDGEGDDLSRVGRVGEDLLVAGVAGVEDHLAGRLSSGAASRAFEDVARCEGQDRLGHSECTSFPPT